MDFVAELEIKKVDIFDFTSLIKFFRTVIIILEHIVQDLPGGRDLLLLTPDALLST